MKREFVVTDETGNVSYGFRKKSDDSEPETFGTFKAAKARAGDLAQYSPGNKIKIYELTAEVDAPVQPVRTTRKHPVEYYN